MEGIDKDRRKIPRVVPDSMVPVQIDINADRSPILLNAKNISEGGSTLIITPEYNHEERIKQLKEEGEDLSLLIQIPTPFKQMICCSGKMVHSETLEDEETTLGIEFKGLMADDINALQEYIKERQSDLQEEFQGYSHLHVLVVDNHPDRLEIIKLVLEEIGVEKIDVVEDFEHGWEALHQENKIDLLLLSWDFPDITGEKFAIRIRRSEDSELRKLPIIICASKPNRKHIAAAKKLWVRSYISPPFNLETTKIKLMEILEGGG